MLLAVRISLISVFFLIVFAYIFILLPVDQFFAICWMHIRIFWISGPLRIWVNGPRTALTDTVPRKNSLLDFPDLLQRKLWRNFEPTISFVCIQLLPDFIISLSKKLHYPVCVTTLKKRDQRCAIFECKESTGGQWQQCMFYSQFCSCTCPVFAI